MIAAEIAQALSTRLSAITKVNGYHTDCGSTVYRGRRRLDAESPPCIVIAELEDTVMEQTQKGSVHLSQVYAIEAHAETTDPDHPNDLCHQMLFDLKRAVFRPTATLHTNVRKIEYRGRTIGPRDEGTTLVYASIRIAVEYAEKLGET